MSQAPTAPSPQKDSLYVLIGVVGGLFLVCGGFFLVIVNTVSGLAQLSVAAKATRVEGGPEGEARAAENDRMAAARAVAQAFLEDLKANNYTEAFAKTGGLLQRQSIQDLKDYIRKDLAIRKIDKFTLGKATGTQQVPTFGGSIEQGKDKLEIAISLGMEGTEYRVLEFKAR